MNWGFLGRMRGGDKQPVAPQPSDGAARVSELLAALDDGVIASGMPTLVCRTCGLKYDNTGTFLHGATCPDCTVTGG